jgi:hypothetical protein
MLTLLDVVGDDEARGRQFGRLAAPLIRTVFAAQDAAETAADGTGLREWWARTGQPLGQAVAQHTPRTHAELVGMAAGAGLPLDDLLALTCSYEKHMKWRPSGRASADAAHCTAFAATGAATADGHLLCGQNNDEVPSCWAHATADVVVRHRQEDGLTTLLYTHPGIPAYMGMNSAGLCVLWMYIDNGERGLGAPTCALLREVLHQRTLAGALAWLQAVPHALPNAFTLAADGEGMANVEIAPRHVAITRGDTWLVHANTICATELLAGTGRGLPPACPRQARLADLLTARLGALDLAAGQAMLQDTAPIANHRPLCYPSTIASMVFHPAAGAMHIAIGPGPGHPYARVPLRPS